MAAGAIVDMQNSPAASPRPFYTTRLYPAGGKLIVSNNPEEVNGQGILYRDSNMRGAWRVCVHHQNKTGSEPGGVAQPVQLLIIVANPDCQRQTVVIERSGVGVHSDPQSAGCQALRQYLQNSRPDRREIPPGQSLAWGVSSLAFGDTFSGLYDFYSLGALDVAVVALFAGNRELSAANLAYFPRHKNANGTYTIRGTFPYRELRGQFRHYAGSGWQGTQLGNNPYGDYRRDIWWDWTWSQVYRGEYPAGWNAVEREVVYNWGNYGVFYHLDYLVEHRIASGQQTQILFNPRGGAYYGPACVDGEIVCPATPIKALRQAMLLKELATFAGEQRVAVTFMPPGGSSLPVRILLGKADAI